jgi:uncharacterized tellurite resistance protein B-like protein
MFEHLRNLLRIAGQTRNSREDTSLTPISAAAVLLLEIARADYDHQPAERAALRAGLSREFGVPEAELDALLAQAETKAQESVSLFEFVQVLNRTQSAQDKARLVELLWDVAHADGKVDPHEEHLLRRVADLLHVPHAEFIRGKLAAAEKKNS